MIRGPQVTPGYYKNPDATAAAFFPDHWLRSGDLGYRDTDGFFFVTGRIKELIIKGGENIAPREIDEALLRHPAVLDAAAVGIPDRHYGQDIMACVDRARRPAMLRGRAARFLQSRTGRYKTPKVIRFVDDLPRGPSGKVQRLKLAELAPDTSAAASPHTSPSPSAAAVMRRDARLLVCPVSPILRWLPDCVARRARATLAGLTGAIVVLPQGVAFATLAGMPPEYGLYGAMVPCVMAALFGSSRLMVTGPATAISLTTLALIAPLATPGPPNYIALVLTLTFLVGALQLALGLARAGRLIDFVPHSVIVGFTAGAAILIINSQIGPFLGLDLPRGTSVIDNVRAALAQWRNVVPARRWWAR